MGERALWWSALPPARTHKGTRRRVHTRTHTFARTDARTDACTHPPTRRHVRPRARARANARTCTRSLSHALARTYGWRLVHRRCTQTNKQLEPCCVLVHTVVRLARAVRRLRTIRSSREPSGSPPARALPLGAVRWMGEALSLASAPRSVGRRVLLGLLRAKQTLPDARALPYHDGRVTVPCGIPCRARYRAVWDTMPCGIPCHKGYRAVWDTVPCGIPCRAGYRAVRDTVPCGIPHLAGLGGIGGAR